MPKPPPKEYEIVAPEPASLIESLRAVGYTLPTAIADIVDNSITAKARNVFIQFHWAGADSSISILDDGHGMSETELRSAMRPGSRSPIEKRSPNDLGRFGLGLKTASFSQCRELCLISKPAKGQICARTWDLNYVTQLNQKEWRLLIRPSAAAARISDQLSKMPKGTAVVWSNLDRISGGESSSDAVAHSRFNDSIDQVKEHLALTFHRFLEGRKFKIHLNGNPILPWNPFMEDDPRTSVTPEEHIPFGDSRVTFRGFVLPHKDALTEEEFRQKGGPRGWTAQQGFYVYRNKRLLVYGDWLRLGRPSIWTREDHYRLARIRLDLLNDADIEWQLDVKKSTARPPALIRDRLTDLAETVRAKARSVFAHRGKYGRRAATPNATERPWLSSIRENRRVYTINRSHPAIQRVLHLFGEKSSEIDALLRLLEETVPVEQIWLDTAEQSRDHAPPYDGIDFAVIKADMRRVVEFSVSAGINRATAIERLRSVEPFDRYQKLINEL
jgi:hypothetical protein